MFTASASAASLLLLTAQIAQFLILAGARGRSGGAVGGAMRPDGGHDHNHYAWSSVLINADTAADLKGPMDR